MGPMGRGPAGHFTMLILNQFHQSLIDNILNPEDTTAIYALSNAAYSPAPLSLFRSGESRSIFLVGAMLAQALLTLHLWLQQLLWNFSVLRLLLEHWPRNLNTIHHSAICDAA